MRVCTCTRRGLAEEAEAEAEARPRRGEAEARRGKARREAEARRGARGRPLHPLRHCEMLTATTPALSDDAPIWKPLDGTPDTTMSALA